MMWIAILLGAFVGGVPFGWAGACAGACIGGLIAVHTSERDRRRRAEEAAERRLQALDDRLASVEAELRRERLGLSGRGAETALGPGFTAPLWTPPEGPTIDPTAPFGRVATRGISLEQDRLVDEPPPHPLEPAELDARRDALADDAIFADHARSAPGAARAPAGIGGAAQTATARPTHYTEPATGGVRAATGATEASDAGLRGERVPSAIDRIGESVRESVREWALGGNPLVKIGIAILFFGLAFLIKYAYERLQIPIEVRLSVVAAFAMALLGIGFRMRHARPDFGLSLQGGGIALLYLTVFGAIRIWPVLPTVAGFVLLAIVAAAGAMLAVLQNSRTLATVGVTGGFLAPVLASTGAGSHIALFSYYALLNLGILAIAHYRSWRFLNFVGFAFTFVIGTAWGVLRYRPEIYATTQPFLIFFIVLYLALAIRYALRETEGAGTALDRYLDGTLVFGVPIIGFALQAGLVNTFEYGTAISALVAALAYAGLATYLNARTGARLAMMVQAFIAIAVAFATLAIPLALDGRWTAAAWALEGAALVWVGVHQRRVLARLAGYALQACAAFALIADFNAANGTTPFADAFFLGTLLIAVAGWVCATTVRASRDKIGETEAFVPEVAVTWALGWLSIGIAHELIEHIARPNLGHTLGVAGIAIAVLTGVLARRMAWAYLARAALGSVLVLAGAFAIDLAGAGHPFRNWGWLAWPVMFVWHYWILRALDANAGDAARWLHSVTLWLLVGVLGWEAGWQVDRWVDGASVWGAVGTVIVPAAALALLAWLAPRGRWPLEPNLAAYLYVGGLPIAALLAAWLVFVNLASSGSAAPLPYVPLINPLDIAQVGIVFVLLVWINALETYGFTDVRLAKPQVYWGALGAFAFLFANGVLIRTLHHWAGVPFDFSAMMSSKLVQAAISIFWTVLALAATVMATRIASRPLWIVGAILIGTVVAKLLLIDLSGGVERIVSFIVVGVLLLAIGYFAPLPPRRSEDQ